MTAELSPSIRASRFTVPRTRGAFSGLLIVLLGAWAGIVPFIGPYLDFAYTPSVNDSWNWTAGRGWLNVLPGAVAFVGGLLLLMSTSRVVALAGGWLAAAAGAWLIVGPTLAVPLQLGVGTPDPTSSSWVRALEFLFFYTAVGAAILFLAASAHGRLSVQSVRDVRAAERRAAEVAAAEEAAAVEQRRVAEERAVRDRGVAERGPVDGAGTPAAERGPVDGAAAPTAAQRPVADAGRHEADGTPGYPPPPEAYRPPEQQHAYTPAPPPPEQQR